MTLDTYSKLDIDEKADVLWRSGLFIELYGGKDNAYNLYSLSGFFVEVTISNQENKILEIVPFNSGERLDKYLTRITIS